MRIRFLTVILFALLLSTATFGYEYEGTSQKETTVGSTDLFKYDLDAAFTFSGGTPDATGPSVYFGSKAVQSEDGTITEYPDEVDSDDSIRKFYIPNEGSNNWGQGNIDSTIVQITDAITRSARDGIPYLVPPPQPQASQDENRCGDAIMDAGNDEISCPEDYGLPSDAADSSTDADSRYTITRTFNDEVGQYDVNDIGSVSGVGDGGDDTDDFISYDAGLTGSSAFVAEEHNQDETEDITGKFKGSGTVTYEDENWQETPDFYLKDGGTEIWMKYVKLSGSTAISDSQNPVQTYDLTTGTFDDYADSASGSYSDTSCSASSGWECDGTDHDVDCKSVSQNTVDSHYLKQETITLNADAPTRYMTSEGSNNDINEDTSNAPSFTVDVTYNHDYGTTEVDADNCASGEDGTITTYTCDNTSYGGSCSTSGSEDYYNEDTGNPDGEGTGVYYDGVDQKEWEYRYQTLTYDDAKIFDVNPAENPSGHPLDSDFALFRGTSFKTNSGASTINDYDNVDRDRLSILTQGETAYYSWDITKGSEDFSNDPAVSLSTFSMDVTGGVDFHSVRDTFETYDADGPYGESDGFIAIEHDIQNEGTSYEQKSSSRSITGTTSLFLQEESQKSNSESSIQYMDFVSTSNVPIPSCPGDQVKCVAMVDVSLKDVNNWGSNNPSTGFQFDITGTPPPTSQSMSVCKMYQRISNEESFSLDSSSNQQCEFEEGDYTNSGGGGDDDPDPSTCGSMPGYRWHYMEGPEVKEDTFTSTSEQSVSDDYEACVAHSECVYKGTNVTEGTVANVASDNYAGYENGGDSNDWEVCLNIHDVPGEYPDVSNGYHDKGAHEFGGQWYDLDDDRVDYYLRPSNDDGTNGGEDDYDGQGHRLISDASSSQREDPQDVSYYYRKNPNPFHPEWNPLGYTTSGSDKEYYYGFNVEADCDQDLSGCGDSNVNDDINNGYFFSFLWENQGQTVSDYDLVRSPPA